MCVLFEKFPEILLVDGTYNVNRARMPLYCFMIEDGFGNGSNIFYSATAEEIKVPYIYCILFRHSNYLIPLGSMFA